MSLKYYTSPIEVYNKLTKAWKRTPVNKGEVFENCIDAEINYIKDGDLFSKFTEFPIEIDKTVGLGSMPCNVIRIIEVYDESGNDVDYVVTGSNHIKVVGYDKVYMHFLGAIVDEDGIPVIHQGHVNALVTFNLMKFVEQEVLLQRMPLGFLQKYEQQFSNQVVALKQSAQYKDKSHYDKVNIIRFNMLKKVGHKRLIKTMFE